MCLLIRLDRRRCQLAATLARLFDEYASSRPKMLGIGAGPECDGQVLIIHDVLGLNPDFMPRLAKRFVDLGAIIREAATMYMRE